MPHTTGKINVFLYSGVDRFHVVPIFHVTFRFFLGIRGFLFRRNNLLVGRRCFIGIVKNWLFNSNKGQKEEDSLHDRPAANAGNQTVGDRVRQGHYLMPSEHKKAYANELSERQQNAATPDLFIQDTV
jgi:hypothetical protein